MQRSTLKAVCPPFYIVTLRKGGKDSEEAHPGSQKLHPALDEVGLCWPSQASTGCGRGWQGGGLRQGGDGISHRNGDHILNLVLCMTSLAWAAWICINNFAGTYPSSSMGLLCVTGIKVVFLLKILVFCLRSCLVSDHVI